MQPAPRVKPCGCIVTESFGHTHTKLCETHWREVFGPRERDSLDAVARDNLDLVGG